MNQINQYIIELKRNPIQQRILSITEQPDLGVPSHKTGDMPSPPEITYKQTGNKIIINVKPPSGNMTGYGRIWWMFDRGSYGGAAYLNELFPPENWTDMDYDSSNQSWTAEIEVIPGASTIDLFSNHGKVLNYREKAFQTYISSPYKRIELGKE